MKYKTWKRITSVLVCAAMMLSMHMPAISLTIDDINSGNQFYHSSKKFLMIRSPTFPLFSGWNWQV